MQNLFVDIKSADLAPLFDFIPDIQFWIKDRNHIFRWVNKGFLDNYAMMNMSEVIGKTDYNLSPFYIARQFEQDDQAVLLGKVIINRIELVSSVDTTIHFCMTNKRPVISPDGKIIGTMGITRKLNDHQNPEIPITKLSEIVQYIHENIHHPLSIVHMAEQMHCSVSSLERLFRRLLQATPMEFIRKIKMQYASKSLINTDLSVSEIAYSLGYADQSHFIREFKKLVKETPFHYRKRYYNLSTIK